LLSRSWVFRRLESVFWGARGRESTLGVPRGVANKAAVDSFSLLFGFWDVHEQAA
jgi:hypothetical protein